ncbi:MAG TPA: hypothetical protein VJS87_04980 [Solirubrobacterales bacterium]|nr:hypothetical protein [Solirubrobacterales bacterium]
MPTEAPSPAEEAAEQTLAFLTEMSVDVRGGAILGAGGDVLAATGEREAWRDAAAALLAPADAADGRAADQIHVGTGQGEVFAVREGGLTAVVVTERFTLASLMAFDMRSALRDLAGGGNGHGGRG